MVNTLKLITLFHLLANGYLAFFDDNNITQSMSNQGKYHDNAVLESFFSRLKTELVQLKDYQTRELAKSKIFEYIEIFYNKVRRHSYLNYDTPKILRESIIIVSLKKNVSSELGEVQLDPSTSY